VVAASTTSASRVQARTNASRAGGVSATHYYAAEHADAVGFPPPDAVMGEKVGAVVLPQNE
jgi:hypothetical protein